MMEIWKTFMAESNRIEGEDRLNPGDQEAYEHPIETLEDILEVHRILTAHLNVPWSGRWRQINVRVGTYYPPGYIFVPEKMEAFIHIFPSLGSYSAHNIFERIHPFQDFNGRVGRLIWAQKARHEGFNFSIPFLQKYYYQTLNALNLWE